MSIDKPPDDHGTPPKQVRRLEQLLRSIDEALLVREATRLRVDAQIKLLRTSAVRWPRNSSGHGRRVAAN